MKPLVGRVVALAAVPVLALAACGDDDDGTGGGDAGAGGGDRLEVVASFYPLAEAASRVGGDRVEVTNLTPPGVEPHDVELSPDQVDQLEDADVLLYLGAGFQPAVAEVAERRDGATVDVSEQVDLEAGAAEALEAHGHGDEEEHAEGEGEHAAEEGAGADDHAAEEGAAADDHAAEEAEGDDHAAAEGGEGDEHAEGEGGEDHAGELDPHFWLDPQRMAEAVGEIETVLAEESPDDADAFAANARRYQDDLTALDEEMAAALSSCERDEIVTSHAAFHYLAERYGLTQLPIAGLSPEAEPDAARLAELADRIEDEGITTVFYETLVSPEVAETLAREAGVETAVLNPIEGLTEEQVDAGDDYASVMQENLAALTEALGCG